jgi:hypothetical protein
VHSYTAAALGHYVREEARGVLLRAGLTPFVAAVEEACIADVLVLDRLRAAVA